jgi:hypothetical protein
MRRGPLLVAVLIAGVVMMFLARRSGEPGPTAGPVAAVPDWYAPPPPVRSFPATSATVRAWIRAGDTASIRTHGWDMWESITTAVAADSSMPVWETWYSGHEVFDAAPNPTGEIRRRGLRHQFELPRQRVHGMERLSPQVRRAPDFAERWFSFNRYTRPTARFIYLNRLWDYRVLRDTNEYFNRAKTPIGEREVKVSAGDVDAESIVLKPVFQFVSGTSASCIPYWDGNTPATASNNDNPVADTWKQFVIIDPTNQLTPGTTVSGAGITGCPSGSFLVVPLTNFYAVTITQEMADSLSVFATQSGDDLGAGNRADSASIVAMAKPGNLALLMAMHVTGKEIVEWTWQTFWWSPAPNDSLGFDRPSTIKSPWNNYQMNTAYWMVFPAGAGTKGTPRVAFNPYLETSLCADPPGCQNSPWYGVQSNCMSCHRQAAWKDIVVTDSTGAKHNSFTGPPYVPAQFVDKSAPDPFATYTKTDFLWSVAIRTRAIPPYTP